MTSLRDHFACGALELLSACDAVLAVFQITVVGGVASGNAWEVALDRSTVRSELASGAALATKAQMMTAGGDPHITGLTVGVWATDILMDGTSIIAGKEVTLSLLPVITRPTKTGETAPH